MFDWIRSKFSKKKEPLDYDALSDGETWPAKPKYPGIPPANITTFPTPPVKRVGRVQESSRKAAEPDDDLLSAAIIYDAFTSSSTPAQPAQSYFSESSCSSYTPSDSSSSCSSSYDSGSSYSSSDSGSSYSSSD